MKKTLKIMTFNVQHCADYSVHLKSGEHVLNIPRVAKEILKAAPDIVGLNEIRGNDIKSFYGEQTELLREYSGMAHCFFAPAVQFSDGPYGNAMLSNLEPISIENIKIPDPEVRKYNGYYETRGLIKAKFEGGLTVLVTHFGLNPDEVENAIKTVLENLEDEKCIFMGDLNLVEDDERLDAIRERMTDTALVFGKGLLTFPSDAPKIKLDYIFVSKDIKVKNVFIPTDVVSDHLPFVAEIEVEF